MAKDADAYRTISEVAEALDIPPHVLRFWETKFFQIRPLKRAGGRRYYRRADVDLLCAIRRLLYQDAYTIRGVQRLLKTQGPSAIAAMAPGSPPDPEVETEGFPTRTGRTVDTTRPTIELIEALATEIVASRALLAVALAAWPEPRSEA